MNKTEIRERIESLRIKVVENNYKYYVLNQSTISDFEYDILINELDTLEKKYPEFFSSASPTQRVGSDLTKEFEQVEHKYPMLSLGNTYNEEELREFDNRTRKLSGDPFEYVCELKYDGASISIYLRKGFVHKGNYKG